MDSIEIAKALVIAINAAVEIGISAQSVKIVMLRAQREGREVSEEDFKPFVDAAEEALKKAEEAEPAPGETETETDTEEALKKSEEAEPAPGETETDTKE